MINQLKKLYPSLQLLDQNTLASDSAYTWFSCPDGVTIGIHERELAPRDLSLLATFLTPYNPKFPMLTDEEKKWAAVVDPALSDDSKMFPLNSSYRFVHFSIQEKQISPAAFKQAVQDFYAQHVPILWQNDHQGVLVEYVTKEDGPISYDEIIDVLMSDLYINIHFFVGPLRASLHGAVTHYRAMVDGAKIVSLYSKKTVISYTDAIPYLLLDQTPEPLRNEIKQSVLQVYQGDEETMKMIEVFVRNNLNISETAKALHMHRNSLQYRFDRFYENTGIDVRKFREAMAVYLAILIQK
ncbi:PucR family transcriptional regulator [Planococcus faecalis]|uniref:Regulator of polyketide synthase expression n=1 Tax=Planococcus faecalis TaxID=1598147 RepID=A0ABM6IQ28_9BACL|nr:helix-turn-helix domain-containing protein [Planococcus faecalis]AQU78382.1 regulator of polyketide synthase expression [Planococcus faecalis]OHX52417.1 regulator of polyketide synthase expression [Planococcus faecalis]